MTSPRHYTRTDHFLARIGDGLKAFDPSRRSSASSAPLPAATSTQAPLADAERQQAARLMRVNHAGEVAAQGLYQGQALFARDAEVRKHLLEAAEEERQHLQWCQTRLAELGDGPSKLSPLWYAGSFAIGAVAGLAGDEKSLGFVAETERQVSQHLGEHLERLPAADTASRAVVTRMQNDEQRHGQAALAAGGALPPPPVQGLMRLVAGLMKFAAARF